MAKKSSKTAHVLNLISTPKITEPKEEIKQEIISQQVTESVEPDTSSSPVQSSLERTAKNEEISEKIKEGLLEELGLSQPTKQSEEPVQTSVAESPQPAQATVTESPQPAQATVAEPVQPIQTTGTEPAQPAQTTGTEPAQPAQATVTESPQPAQATVTESPQHTQATIAEPIQLVHMHKFRYINICEELVKEKLDEYMERFHVCTCSRCRMDAMALALSHLPSKYVVMDVDSAVPFLSYYSNKMCIEIMTELTKACLIVSANPRHKLEDVEAENKIKS